MTTGTQPPEFDAGNWGKMVRFACRGWRVSIDCTVAILSMVDPPERCPAWTPLWEMIVLASRPAIGSH